MLLTARPGEFAASVSMRVNVTAPGVAAFAFCETKTRPVVVAAQSVDASLVERWSQPTLPPPRVPACPVSEGPTGTQSPHVVPGANAPVNSLQFASRYALGPPLSSVRQTWLRP